ncbi:Geminin [Geodia barretti]|uniref:Geminin n=2 Tax=Geodia barretti TaxID=519541 RepID=A0AA35QX10_GEOBA|nr:Geminin [Geodia barretti]
MGRKNISQGKSRKSSQKTASCQSDRITLRLLEPYSSGEKCAPLAAKIPPSKNKFAVNKASAVTDVRKSRVQVKNKGVQTEIGSLDHEMCTSEEPPLEYWKVLAEQRRQALAETLQENEELHSENETLRKKIAELERRLENKDYFAMMYQIACNDSTQDQ